MRPGGARPQGTCDLSGGRVQGDMRMAGGYYGGAKRGPASWGPKRSAPVSDMRGAHRMVRGRGLATPCGSETVATGETRVHTTESYILNQ